MENLLEQRKNMIESLVGEKQYVPMKEKEMAILLQVKKEDKDAFHQVIDELLGEGRIMLTPKGKS